MKYTVLVMIIITSCHKTSKTNITKQLKRNEDLIKIQIPPFVNSQTKDIQYFTNNGENILAYGSNNQIYFFSLDSLTIVKSTNYQQYGPQGIPNFMGFHVLNMDSIILTSQRSIIITNSNDSIYTKLDLLEWNSKFIQPFHIFSPSARSDFHPVRLNNKLYFSTFQFDIESSDFSETSIGLYYDLNNNSIHEMEFNYPKFPRNYESINHNVSRVYRNNKWIYSFGVLDDVFVFDNTGNYDMYPLRSLSHAKKVRINNEYSYINAIRSPSYMSIKYDPWRDVFYRIFYPGYEVQNNKDEDYYHSLVETPPLFSVIIIDSNFRIIGETTMPFQHYDPHSNFITKEGLFFGLHVNHPEFDPDYLSFARFSLESINP